VLFSIEIGRDGAVIEFAESAKGKDQVDTAEVARIIDGSGTIVEVVEDLVEILASINGTVVIETGKVDVDDMLCEIAILGEPDLDGG